eukprot:TRINITY_DN50305_c0_g1_i1.p1 TRINITY_DN50305_c0_g1~~TRINITY_DN50305_c0_g1_i1.p1  ORF type:complete len:262 (+),score=49.35 TRINITY_DN50305_c0_g1_i1:67-786(+)
MDRTLSDSALTRGAQMDGLRSRRQDVIKDELSCIARGAASEGSQPPGLRGKVRKLIAEELESVLAQGLTSFGKEQREPSDFVRECMATKAVRDAQGVRPIASLRLGRSKSSSELDPKLPPLAVKHNEFTRKIMFYRNANGGFVSDAPDWPVDTATAPILPSKHREMSKWLWGSINQNYEFIPEVSDARTNFRKPKNPVYETRLFMNPKDDFVEYREAKFQVGNKLTMRKGGGSMAKGAK